MKKLKSKFNSNKNFSQKIKRISITVDLSFIFKIFIFMVSFICLWYVLYYKHIIFYLNKNESKYESLFFSILVSMTLLLFMVGFGININVENKYLKFPIVCLVIYFVYLGYQYVGLGIIFETHFGILFYNIYESNTEKGILFFIYNIFPLFIAWIIHLPFMSEKE